MSTQQINIYAPSQKGGDAYKVMKITCNTKDLFTDLKSRLSDDETASLINRGTIYYDQNYEKLALKPTTFPGGINLNKITTQIFDNDYLCFSTCTYNPNNRYEELHFYYLNTSGLIDKYISVISSSNFDFESLSYDYGTFYIVY